MAAGCRIFVDADKNIFWWLKKRGTTHLFTNFYYFPRHYLERQIDQYGILHCRALQKITQHNRTGHINLPTHQPYALVSSSSPWGPGYAGENAGPNDIATPWSFLFFEDLGSFFAEKSRVEQGILTWKMKVKNIPYNLILINLLHLLRISDHLFQTINV